MNFGRRNTVTEANARVFRNDFNDRFKVSIAEDNPFLPYLVIVLEQLFDNCNRLFVPFERLGAARRGIDGNGLGLVVSRALAEAMGGTIEVASTPLVGSVFTLRLPAVRAAAGLRTPALAGAF